MTRDRVSTVRTANGYSHEGRACPVRGSSTWWRWSGGLVASLSLVAWVWHGDASVPSLAAESESSRVRAIAPVILPPPAPAERQATETAPPRAEPSSVAPTDAVDAESPLTVAVDLQLELPDLGRDAEWGPTGSPLADILLVDGGRVQSDPGRVTWPEWSPDDDVPTWRDFAFVTVSAARLDLAVAVPLVPMDGEGNVTPGIVQWCVGEVSSSAAELRRSGRLALRARPGTEDVVVRVTGRPRATVVPRLAHVNARGWLPASFADRVVDAAWPASAERFRRAVALDDGRFLPVTERSFPVRLDAAGELCILGAPRGLVWVDGVEVIAEDGTPATGFAAIGTAGRIEAAGARQVGYRLGAVGVIDVTDSAASLLPRFEFDLDPAVSLDEGFPPRVEIHLDDQKRTWLASGVVDPATRAVDWQAASVLSAALGSPATLVLSGPGVADAERPLRVSPDEVVRMTLAPPPTSVRFVAELPGLAGCPVSVPVVCSYRVASSRPVFKARRWLVDGDAAVTVADVDGRALTAASGAFLSVSIDAPALRAALNAAWRSVYGDRAVPFTVWVERDLEARRDLPLNGLLDEAGRTFRQRADVRVIVTEGELRRTLADYVVERRLVAAFRAAAAPPVR